MNDPKDRRDFVDVFYALTTNDGKRAAQLMAPRKSTGL